MSAHLHAGQPAPLFCLPDADMEPVELAGFRGKKVVVDVGGRIADARVLDMKAMRTTRKLGELSVQYMLPERADFEKAVQAAGIDQHLRRLLGRVVVGERLENLMQAVTVLAAVLVRGHWFSFRWQRVPDAGGDAEIPART